MTTTTVTMMRTTMALMTETISVTTMTTASTRAPKEDPSEMARMVDEERPAGVAAGVAAAEPVPDGVAGGGFLGWLGWAHVVSLSRAVTVLLMRPSATTVVNSEPGAAWSMDRTGWPSAPSVIE